MSDKLRVGIIGTGRKKERADVTGFFMAYSHAAAWQATGQAEVVACADIVADNANAFAEYHGLPAEAVYLDYKQMLAEANLDAVSICTWMHLHSPMVIAAAEAGVKVIHCEKPMADTFGAAKRMAAAARAAGAQLTFNHQRRYGEPFKIAKQLLDAGEIGELVRIESDCGNIYDTGTHFIDMMSFFNNESPGKWVLAQIDYRQENLVFGHHCENQSVVMFEYANGVHGLYLGGSGAVGAVNKLYGTEGVIEVGWGHGPAEAIRWRKQGQTEWILPDTKGQGIHGPGHNEAAMADVVDCYLNGRKCQLDASNALIATEIIFGAWESSRRRGRIDFPLDIEDNPLAAMVASGDLKPERPEAVA